MLKHFCQRGRRFALCSDLICGIEEDEIGAIVLAHLPVDHEVVIRYPVDESFEVAYNRINDLDPMTLGRWWRVTSD